MGASRGRGRRNRFYATGLYGWQRAGWGVPAFGGASAGQPGPALTREQELDALKAQAAYLQDVLEGIGKRIDELQDKPGATTE